MLRSVGGRPSNGSGEVRVHLVIPKSFNDAQDVADKFKDSIPVIINLQGSETDLSKRLIDFASGLTYALDGGMQRIADKVFLLTPRNVELSSEERARLIEKGFFNQSSRLSEPMLIGFVGAGNMARALALGWGEPVLCTDSGSGRAKELAALVGGEAVATNRALAARADLVILAHKPAQLAAVAAEIAGHAKAVVSILARTTQAELRAAYPGTPVFRVEPNTPVEVRRGVLAFAVPDADVDAALHAEVRERFARIGTVVEIPEA